MINTIFAEELKQRGIHALEERLSYGAVHILEQGRPICVVLSETEYARLTALESSVKQSLNVWTWLEKPVTGNQTRQEIDARLAIERDAWNQA